MIDIIYKESTHKFTDPIRYFKANDPIYYEVDNIPLKQLHENSLWIKDQITNNQGEINGIDRSGFTELKPYVLGNDNIVRVKPGRFTARINNVFNIQPLQLIFNLTGEEMADHNAWITGRFNNAFFDGIRTEIMGGQSTGGFNGLVERCFSYPAIGPGKPGDQFIDRSNPTLINLPGTSKSPFPISEAQLWTNVTPGYGIDSYYILQYNNSNPTIGFAALGVAETAFIKRWRGVARTSVVDLAEETTLEIAPFNREDFFYTNPNGDKVILSATQRIDLLFMYSKPIDASSVTVAKYIAGQPTTIIKPMLGVVHGAGLGADFRSYSIQNYLKNESAIRSNGDSMIFPGVGDQTNSLLGFDSSELNPTIRGSFPSPDDLMNLTPMLAESLEEDSYALIGQSILPLAYIVVRADATITTTDVPGTSKLVLSDTDIIDIRPFFRTTELSYNERAGIAASIPAPSLANPVVTQGELDYEVKRVYLDLASRINMVSNSSANENKPRVVGGGYIKGGYLFGVEGVLARYLELRVSPGSSKEALKQQVITRYNLPAATIIPDFPDWDLGAWVGRNNLPNPGVFVNDYVNLHQWGSNATNRNSKAVLFETAYNDLASNAILHPEVPTGGFNPEYLRIPKLNTRNGYESGMIRLNTEQRTGVVTVHYVKKTIFLNRARVSNWMDDYHVNVQLWNCCPLSCPQIIAGDNRGAATNSIWVEKLSDRFTIYVSWVTGDNPTELANTGHSIDLSQFGYRNTENHAGFIVINQDIALSNFVQKEFNGESNCGVTNYPTVTYQIIGFPSSNDSNLINANESGPTLLLV
jgi:hypothetical protein